MSDKKLVKASEAKIIIDIVEGRYFEKPIGNNITCSPLVDEFMKEYVPEKSVYTTNWEYYSSLYTGSTKIPYCHFVYVFNTFSCFKDDSRFISAMNHTVMTAGIFIGAVVVPIGIVHQFLKGIIVCVSY